MIVDSNPVSIQVIDSVSQK